MEASLLPSFRGPSSIWIPADDWSDEDDHDKNNSSNNLNLSCVPESDEVDECDGPLSHLGGNTTCAFGFGMGYWGGRSAATAQKMPVLIAASKRLQGDILQVACGTSNSAAIIAGVGLVTWGKGTHGQLGHGDVESHMLPKVVESLSGVGIVQIACGRSFMLCISSQGKVYSWGRGGYGRLGHGGTFNQLHPTMIKTFSDCHIVSVAAGGGHALAVDDDGAVYSWGQGRTGQLGFDPGEEQFATVPQRVYGLAMYRVHRVCCGHSHSMALTEAGEVYSWGGDNNGCLGHGDSDATYCATPRKLRFNGRVTGIACGGFHSSAIVEGGLLYTWGRGNDGALGHGGRNDEYSPRMVETFKDNPVVFAACGDWHTVAFVGSGQLYSWGCADSGQLGLSSTSRQLTPQVVSSLKGKGVMAVSCGGAHTVAVVRQSAYEMKSYSLRYSVKASPSSHVSAKKKPSDRMWALKEMMNTANAFFSASEFRESGEWYEAFLHEALIVQVDNVADLSSSQQREVRHMIVAVRLNLAICMLKQGDTKAAIRCCNEVLDAPGGNDGLRAKAYTRRGRAYLAEEEWLLAKQDFVAALKANPENSEARKVLLQLVRKQQQSKGSAAHSTKMYPASITAGTEFGYDGPKTPLLLGEDENEDNNNLSEIETVLFPHWNPMEGQQYISL